MVSALRQLKRHTYKQTDTRMWADAQRDGRPVEYS